MKAKLPKAEPELSRPLRVEKISPNGVEETIVASGQEREALSKRFDLIDVGSLEAKLHVMPKQGATDFEVTGHFRADVTQRCVVTLEPLPAHIEQAIKVHFAPPVVVASGATERALGEDDLEPIEDGIMDLGELVAQHLGLALDPYPRKPDVPPVEVEFGAPAAKISPFAKLAALKDKTEE